MPVHIHAPTTVQRNGQGLILMRIWERLFSTPTKFVPPALIGWISHHKKEIAVKSRAGMDFLQ